MDFDAIMAAIEASLIGDNEKDLVFLEEQKAKYKEHEFAPEILRAIGRLVYERLPEEKKEAWLEILKKEAEKLNQELVKAQDLAISGSPAQAFALLEPLLAKVDTFAKEDRFNDYYSFRDMIDFQLYCYRYKPKQPLRPAAQRYSDLYFLCGYLQMQLGQYNKAFELLLQGIKWNPMDAGIYLALAEASLALGDWEQFFAFTKSAAGLVRSAQELVRCYHYFAYYYENKTHDYKTAAMFYTLSQVYFETNSAKAELERMQKEHGLPAEPPGFTEIEEQLEDLAISPYPDEDVVGITLVLAENAETQQDLVAARNYYEVAYNLTKNDIIKDKLAKIAQILPSQ